MKDNSRLLSLDALRGFDMLFIMGFSTFVIALCSLFPGGESCFLAQTMKHVEWHGLAHHDTIFPLFLFLAGVSFPFSYAKSLAGGATKYQIYHKIAKRAVLLILFGLIYNGLFKFDFEHLRVCSVLGRIGVAWAISAVLYINFGRVSRAVICGVILVAYYLIVCYLPAPDVDGADLLSMQGTIVGYIDRIVTPGRLIYDNGSFDPEGLFSTLPAVVTAMLGVFAGEYVRSEKHSGSRKTLMMLLAAAVMLAVGLLWSVEFPINKKLWTSSFVLVVGAYSLAMFALFYYVIDVRGWHKWTLPFQIIGINSITIYMAQRIVPFKSVSKFFFGGLAGQLPPLWGDVVTTGGYVLVCWLFLYFLYKKRIFLKI